MSKILSFRIHKKKTKFSAKTKPVLIKIPKFFFSYFLSEKKTITQLTFTIQIPQKKFNANYNHRL